MRNDVNNRAGAGARLALAASFSQLQPWSDASLPRPGARDWDGQIANIASAFAFGHPAVVSGPIEQLAGGTVFWNTGVDYGELFAQSDRKSFVRAMYARAGLDLDADLAALETGDRIEADPQAVDFMEYHSTYTGDIEDPILTLHTIGDPADPLPMERGYTDTIRRAGNNDLLRQSVVDRPGHCNFRPAEIVASLMTVVDRIETGMWRHTAEPASLNARAGALNAASDVDLGESDFVHATLPHPLRTWDGFDW